MSEISTLKLKVWSLSNLKAAGAARDLELLKQDFFKAYGSKREETRCDYVLRIPGDRRAFEIGVIKQPDQSFALAWDDMDRQLVERAGVGGVELAKQYEAITYRNLMVDQGYEISEVMLPDGTLELTATRYE